MRCDDIRAYYSVCIVPYKTAFFFSRCHPKHNGICAVVISFLIGKHEVSLHLSHLHILVKEHKY